MRRFPLSKGFLCWFSAGPLLPFPRVVPATILVVALYTAMPRFVSPRRATPFLLAIPDPMLFLGCTLPLFHPFFLSSFATNLFEYKVDFLAAPARIQSHSKVLRPTNFFLHLSDFIHKFGSYLLPFPFLRVEPFPMLPMYVFSLFWDIFLAVVRQTAGNSHFATSSGPAFPRADFVYFE